MKKKKNLKLHELSDRELESELHETDEKLFRIMYSHSAVPLKNPLEIRINRRRLAQLKTIKRQRELQPKTV